VANFFIFTANYRLPLARQARRGLTVAGTIPQATTNPTYFRGQSASYYQVLNQLCSLLSRKMTKILDGKGI